MMNQELIRKARQTNLVDFLTSRGEQLQREGHDFRLIGNQGLMIRGNGYYCHSNPKGKLDGQPDTDGNNALSFVMYYYHKTFEEAVEMLTGAKIERPAPQSNWSEWKTKTRNPNDPITLDEDGYCDNQRRVLAYLCKKRMLNYELVTQLIKDGKLKQDIRGNACFIITDWNENPIGAEIHGTGDTRYKQTTAHSGYGFHITIGEPKIAMYFESAIDLLSCYQLHQAKLQHHILVSMGGLHDSVIHSLMQSKAGLEHWIAVDNDEAGNSFCKTMLQENQHYKRCVTPKPYKDWNDLLINKSSA